MTRSQYVTAIWEYEKRRDVAVKKISENRRIKLNLTRKIQRWKRQLKRIDERNKLVNKLIKEVNQFFGCDISSNKRDALTILARSVYFKYGIELQVRDIDGAVIGRAIKKYQYKSSIIRNKFNKSFSTNPENKHTYHRFKSYMDERLKKSLHN